MVLCAEVILESPVADYAAKPNQLAVGHGVCVCVCVCVHLQVLRYSLLCSAEKRKGENKMPVTAFPSVLPAP